MSLRITWHGHATWAVETDRHTIIIDPFFDQNPAATLKAAAVKADFLLVSHGHSDHIADAAAIANWCGATVVSNYEITSWLAKEHGVKKTVGGNLGGGVDLPFGRVKLTLAHHSSSLPDGSNGGNPCGFLLTIGDKKLYFACDTGLFFDMKLIGAVGLDLAVVPIGDLFTMGPDDALEAVKLLAPKKAVPSHFNTWPPIAQDGAAWAARVKQETGYDAMALKPGEGLEV